MEKGERVYFGPSLIKAVDEVRRRDHDDTIGAATRRLVRKALADEGVKVEASA